MKPDSVEGPVRWAAGDSELVARIEATLDGGLGRKTRLHHTPRRSVYKLGLHLDGEADPVSVAFKIHHLRRDRHALREALKRGVRWSSARREWRALTRLHELGIPVPAPLAWGRFPSGDEVVVSRFVEGIPLLDCLSTADEIMQADLLASLGESLSKLYDAGFRHGDLHVGNLMVLPRKEREEIVLVDLQSAFRSRREATRLEDIARLELSLRRAGFAAPARAKLRERLGAGAAFPGAYARFLKDHLRGRARRLFALGRRTAEAHHRDRSGLRASRFRSEALSQVLESAEQVPGESRRDGRTRVVKVESDEGLLVVKEVRADSWRRAFADRFRGSSAARAFNEGRRQALLSEGIATPLAYLEEKRLGLPWRSWLILEHVGETDLDALRLPPGTIQEAFGRAFGEWIAEGHALGLNHRDAKGSNIRVHQKEGRWHFAWTDLEDLAGPQPITHADRIRTWSQISASLPDAFFSLETRRAAFTAYASQMALADGEMNLDPAKEEARRESVMREIAVAAIARNHRWKGEGCTCV